MTLILQGVPARVFKIRIYKGVDGDWYWRMTAPNNKIVADSAEGYKTLRGVESAAMKLTMASIHVVSPRKERAS